MKKQILSEQFRRMQKIAGILNENEGEISTDIISFLESNKQELINGIGKRFDFDEDDLENLMDQEIQEGGDSEGNLDPEIAALGDEGLDFSFNSKKVKDVYGDASNFKLEINGKTVYGIAYNV
jgi:hypothetical protein